MRRTRTTIHVVGHGTDLIQGDHARGVHADGEHQRATGSHALHHAANHLQGHGLVAGSVDQTGRTGVDAQGVVAHRARAVGAVSRRKQTREVGIVVRAQHRFIHHQGVGAGRRSIQAWAVILKQNQITDRDRIRRRIQVTIDHGHYGI